VLAEAIQRYPIHSEVVIAHIRKATQGKVSLANTHPFQRELWGRYWVAAHNGNLLDFTPRLHAAFRPVGDTDSERAFCWLMQELAKAHCQVPSVEELTLTLRELLPFIHRHGSFNLLLSNGQALWAHASTHLHLLERQHPFQATQLLDADLRVDFSQHTSPTDRVALVATQPLTANEPWQALRAGELAVLRHGRRCG
jgi:predicted glutamine amidotransferase